MEPPEAWLAMHRTGERPQILACICVKCHGSREKRPRNGGGLAPALPGNTGESLRRRPSWKCARAYRQHHRIRKWQVRQELRRVTPRVFPEALIACPAWLFLW